MRNAGTGFMIVTGYVIVGSLIMLASGQAYSLLNRLREKPARYLRLAMLTFGACVVALGEFGVGMYTFALLSRG